MACGVIKQCSALTKQKCQCKNHVTNNSDFCERHYVKSISINQNTVPTNQINISINSSSNNQTTSIAENIQEYTIPENIFVNGKFIPNINRVKVFKKI